MNGTNATAGAPGEVFKETIMRLLAPNAALT